MSETLSKSQELTLQEFRRYFGSNAITPGQFRIIQGLAELERDVAAGIGGGGGGGGPISDGALSIAKTAGLQDALDGKIDTGQAAADIADGALTPEKVDGLSSAMTAANTALQPGTAAGDIADAALSIAKTSGLTAALAAKAPAALTPVTETGTSVVLNTANSLSAGKYIVCTNAAAIAANPTTGEPAGQQHMIVQGGAGAVTVAEVGVDITNAARTTAGEGEAIMVIHEGSNVIRVLGGIET